MGDDLPGDKSLARLTGKKVAGHTGQSSQLFPVATDRNAQFLATVASDAQLTASAVSRRRLSPQLVWNSWYVAQ